MDRESVLDKINFICRDIFDDDNLKVEESDLISQIDGFDSLSFLNFLNSLEDEFGISMTLKESMTIKTFSELIDAIITKAA